MKTIKSLGVSRRRYYLNDQFTTDWAAGAVNGTPAEPVGGTRTVRDTNSKVSIVGGAAQLASGMASATDGFWYAAISRRLGIAFIGEISVTTNNFSFGFDSNQATGINQHLQFAGTGLAITQNTGGNFVNVGTFTNGVLYRVVVVLRSNGTFWFIRGGAFANWTLLFSLANNTQNPVYPSFQAANATCVATVDNIRVPKRLFIPVPLQSDGFSASTTDSNGHAEANGPVGNAWTNAVGTWGVSSGVAAATALSGGLAIRTIDAGTPNAIVDVNLTRSAFTCGLVVRYQDASNYITAIHNGTNIILSKVVAGSGTELINTAATYSAGATLRVITDGTKIRVFYNNAAVGSAQTVSDFATATKFGLRTSNTGNTFDNFVIWARGNEGQYSGLDNL